MEDSKPDTYEEDFLGDGRRFYTDGKRVNEYLKELVRDSEIERMVKEGFECMLSNYEGCMVRGKLRPFEFVVMEKRI